MKDPGLRVVVEVDSNRKGILDLRGKAGSLVFTPEGGEPEPFEWRKASASGKSILRFVSSRGEERVFKEQR